MAGSLSALTVRTPELDSPDRAIARSPSAPLRMLEEVTPTFADRLGHALTQVKSRTANQGCAPEVCESAAGPAQSRT
jgi:hypothetical protein